MAHVREKLIQNLKTIGNMAHNDKLSTNLDTFTVHTPSSVRGAYRWYYHESRNGNLDKIKELLHNAKNECIIMSTSQQTIETGNIFAELVGATEHSLNGLMNMIETYKDDIATKTSVELMITDTQAFLVHIRKRLVRDASNSND
jgi:hypothetical protein